jgi:localization factor PodJL
MPRGYQQPTLRDYGHDPDAGEWQALRGELVDLLDQVEDQYARANTRDPGYETLAQRVRALREQVGEPQPQQGRHRDALASVQRAVDRFQDRDEPAPTPSPPVNPRDSLQSAILEIRSRQQGLAAPAAANRNAEAARLLAEDAEQRVAEATRRKAAEDAEQKAAEAARRRAAEMAQRAADAAAQRAAEAAMERTAEAAANRAAEVAMRKAADASERQRLASEAMLRRAEESVAAQREAAEAAMRRAEETVAAQRQAAASHYDQLAGAVNGITGRLERLEGNLKTQSGANQSNIKEVAEQVGQLTHVVELLAGAVGETGQVKRLETQISDLTELMHSGPRLDMSAMTKRIDDLSRTVERLAEIQVQNFGREARDIPQQTEALRSGIATIEESVRNVYDRIDAIERTVSLTPAELERLTGAMAAFTEAAARNDNQPHSLVPLLDTLTARINEIEDKDRAIGALNARVDEIAGRDDGIAALKADIEALRQSVVGAVEPRFSAIENRIEALSGRIGAERSADVDTGPLEEQIRQLIGRMDQTGEQLAGLAALYAHAGERGVTPDYEQIAALVAKKTSEAVARTTTEALAHSVSRAPEPKAAALNEEGIAELEKRMSALFAAARADAAPEEISEVQDGIRKVDERLERLEAALRGFKRDEVAPSTPVPEREVKAPIQSEARRLAARDDTMPINPADEGPLVDTSITSRTALQAALDAKTGRSFVAPADAQAASPTETADATGPASEPSHRETAAPRFDPEAVQRPPRPQSSLGDFDKEVFGSAVTPEPTVPTPSVEAAAASSRNTNTFIEAARRAAQRQNPAKIEPSSNSLIGRALARFQTNAATADAPKAPAVAPAVQPKTEKAAKPEKPVKPEKTSKKTLPGSKPAKVYVPEPAQVVLDSEAIRSEDKPVKKQSFLARHRQPILLAASVVAVCLLTLNFIGQRMGSQKPAASTVPPTVETTEEAPAPAIGTEGQSSSMAPELAAEDAASIVEDGLALAADAVAAQVTGPADPADLDPTTVSSIDPAVAMNFSSTQEIPASLDAGAAISDTFGADTIDSPVSFEMAPDNVGPEGLRKAAADGDARAQFEIAAIYTEGSVVPQDYAEAAKWYERAAAQGFAPAQYRLGSLYEGGKGVEKDLEQARLWYQRAAEAGNRMSMHNLAALYASGELGGQEFAPAAEWFEQAALRGMTDSQFNLGMLYARGLGVPQNFETSYKWFSIAAASGDKDAATARDDIAKSLDTEAMGRATDEIAAFKPAFIDLAANFAPIGTWSAEFDPGTIIDNPEVVEKVQMVLNRIGYDVGTPDGLAGPKTAEAIKAFEKATGMTEVGAINPRLLAVLGSQPV